MNIFALAMLSIVMSVAAQFCLKAGVSAAAATAATKAPSAPAAMGLLGSVPVLVGLLLYAASAVVWLAVLARWDVSKAYPLVGVGFALTVGIGMLAGEQVSAQRVAGVALICAGAWLVARS